MNAAISSFTCGEELSPQLLLPGYSGRSEEDTYALFANRAQETYQRFHRDYEQITGYTIAGEPTEAMVLNGNNKLSAIRSLSSEFTARRVLNAAIYGAAYIASIEKSLECGTLSSRPPVTIRPYEPNSSSDQEYPPSFHETVGSLAGAYNDAYGEFVKPLIPPRLQKALAVDVALSARGPNDLGTSLQIGIWESLTEEEKLSTLRYIPYKPFFNHYRLGATSSLQETDVKVRGLMAAFHDNTPEEWQTDFANNTQDLLHNIAASYVALRRYGIAPDHTTDILLENAGVISDLSKRLSDNMLLLHEDRQMAGTITNSLDMINVAQQPDGSFRLSYQDHQPRSVPLAFANSANTLTTEYHDIIRRRQATASVCPMAMAIAAYPPHARELLRRVNDVMERPLGIPLNLDESENVQAGGIPTVLATIHAENNGVFTDLEKHPTIKRAIGNT